MSNPIETTSRSPESTPGMFDGINQRLDAHGIDASRIMSHQATIATAERVLNFDAMASAASLVFHMTPGLTLVPAAIRTAAGLGEIYVGARGAVQAMSEAGTTGIAAQAFQQTALGQGIEAVRGRFFGTAQAPAAPAPETLPVNKLTDSLQVIGQGFSNLGRAALVLNPVTAIGCVAYDLMGQRVRYNGEGLNESLLDTAKKAMAEWTGPTAETTTPAPAAMPAPATPPVAAPAPSTDQTPANNPFTAPMDQSSIDELFNAPPDANAAYNPFAGEPAAPAPAAAAAPQTTAAAKPKPKKKKPKLAPKQASNLWGMLSRETAPAPKAAKPAPARRPQVAEPAASAPAVDPLSWEAEVGFNPFEDSTI